MGMIGDTCSMSAIITFLKEKGYIGWIVSHFARSDSYDAATANANVIAKIRHVLSDSQIKEILTAIAENGQINDSWGAQKELRDFIALYKNRVDKHLSKRF